MILLTRLNGAQFAVNPDLVERMYANPDTTLVMVEGNKYIVTESIDEIRDQIARYRAHIVALARAMSEEEHATLAVVRSDDVDETPGTAVPLHPRK